MCQPRGERERPKNLLELFVVLVHVLEMLVALHGAGWMHRNVRWSSIRRRFGVDTKISWLVAEFDHAAPSPQHNPIDHRLVWKEDAPEMIAIKGEHTNAMDLWYVCQLIHSCKLSWDEDHEWESFANELFADDPGDRPSAREALETLLRLKKRLQQRKRKNRFCQERGGWSSHKLQTEVIPWDEMR